MSEFYDSRYKIFWIIDPPSHGKGLFSFFFVFFSSLSDFFKGICDEMGSIIKKSIYDYLKLGKTFNSMQDLFNWLETVHFVVPVLVTH